MNIDRISVSQVVQEAGVSRGTIYSHFGDATGIFATLWVEAGAEWLDRSRRIPTDPGRSAIDLAFTQILCASRRDAELAEVINIDLSELGQELAVESDSQRARSLWMLSGTIGLALVRLVQGPDAEMVLNLLGGAPPVTHADLAASSLKPHDEPILRRPEFAEIEPVTRAIMLAEMEVVSSSGIAKASMLRICRAARLTPGAASPRFSGVADLHIQTLIWSIRDRAAASKILSVTTQEPSGPEALDYLFSTFANDDSWRLWRNYRMELLIGAIGDEAFAKAIGSELEATSIGMAKFMVTIGFPRALAVTALAMYNVWGVGMHVLIEKSEFLGLIDRDSIARWAQQAGQEIGISENFS
jgi:AcrR family transcriptional regulator